MQRLRSFYDGDRADHFNEPTKFQTGPNQNEICCDLCAEIFYVDDLVFERLSRKIEETLENPFVCQDCLDDYPELAYRQ